MLCFRVAYVFGPKVKEQIHDVTPTLINTRILGVLRECNDIADSILRESGKMCNSSLFFLDFETCGSVLHLRMILVAGEMGKLSQMPLVLLPVHFDRDPQHHVPSCQHSVAIRTFVTNDFMTGHAAQPGLHINEQVHFFFALSFHSLFPDISIILLIF